MTSLSADSFLRSIVTFTSLVADDRTADSNLAKDLSYNSRLVNNFVMLKFHLIAILIRVVKRITILLIFRFK